MFKLHPVLANDTTEVTRLEVCRVLLMRDRTYPWLIAVPEREGLRDLDDLRDLDRELVMAEIDHISKIMKALFKPYKMNVAALGNVVEQLHIHVIARYQNDPAWPAPVWGKTAPVDYDDDLLSEVLENLRGAFDKAP